MDDVNETPTGFISFYSHEEYSQACSYCSDYNLDVLETVIYDFDMLVFFSLEDLYSCALFCLSNLFHITVFQKTCHSGIHWSSMEISYIPTGFLFLIIESDFIALYSFCVCKGYSIWTSYKDGYMILFHAVDQFNCAVSFCEEHQCLYFSYSMDINIWSVIKRPNVSIQWIILLNIIFCILIS